LSRLLLYIILLSLVFGCSTKEPALLPFEIRDISVSDKMKIAISRSYINKMGLPDSTFKYLHDYYSKRDYLPRWINDSTITKEGFLIKKTLSKPLLLSIPLGRKYLNKTDNHIQDEINLTLALAQIISDLKYGFVDYKNKIKKNKKIIPYHKLDSLIQFNFNLDLRPQFLKYGPNDSTYRIIGAGLIKLLDSNSLDTSTFNVKSIKYDTIQTLNQTKKALISKGYFSELDNDSSIFLESLIKFQKDNNLKPDGVIGKYTCMALNESTLRKVERILLAMDKIRDRENRPDKYIHINIPEYKLRYYVDGKIKSEHKIIVGKIETQTPELESKLRKIVFYPFWNVPYSISSKEILPNIKRDSSYLKTHNYELFKNKNEVSADSVDWTKIYENTFPFKVRQKPGFTNSLGIVKFDFYNKYSVYFHDTPSKYLFNTYVRSYSHGCMRTENPIELAKEILSNDKRGWRYNTYIDSLDSILKRGLNHEIKLLSPIPVFVEYQTVSRIKNNIANYIDIYSRDDEYIKIMNEL
tara:strand:+ start:2011 stop:3582 length:1572 start_codon:yes stop_codon:yes gene_type:complete